MMTNDQFYVLLSQTSRKQRAVGIGLLIFGAFLLIGSMAGIDPKADTGIKIGIFAVSGLILLAAAISLYKSAESLSGLKKGEHPLVNAIDTGDATFVVWYYEYVVESSGVTSHHIWIFDRHNKSIIISIKKNRVPEIIGYLGSRFPDALVGYNDENKRLVKERVS